MEKRKNIVKRENLSSFLFTENHCDLAKLKVEYFKMGIAMKRFFVSVQYSTPLMLN